MFKKLRHFEIFSFMDSRMENRCCSEVNRGEEGRVQVAGDEMKSRVLDSDHKVRGLKRERKLKTNIFKQSVSQNIFRRKLANILEFCQSGREGARVKADEKVQRLKTSMVR